MPGNEKKRSLTTANTETNTRDIVLYNVRMSLRTWFLFSVRCGVHTWNHDTLGMRGKYITSFISSSYLQLCLLQCLSLSELLARVWLDVQEKR